MKPNDGVVGLGQQLICPTDVEVKTEVEELISSPASDALQLIFQDSQVDPMSIMLDLTDMLRRDPTLSSLNPPLRLQQGQINVQSGVPIPKRSHLSSASAAMDMRNHGVMDMQLELDDMSGPTTTTSSFGTYGAGSSTLGSSYGASPLAPTSPSLWEIPITQVKQEELDPMNGGPGLCMSGGQRICLSPPNHNQICLSPPNNQDLYVMQNAGPTLAQLNSPPAEESHMLRGIQELSDLNLDVLMTSDILPQSYSMAGTGVKEEYPHHYTAQFPITHSSSVPSSNIMSDLHVQDLSNLSNGGPALSPNHLTLSPTSRLSLSPNPNHCQNNIQIMSPMPQSRASIIKTAPAASMAKTAPSHSGPGSSHSTLHDLLMRKDPTIHDPIRPRSNSNQFKAAKTRIAPRQRSSLSASNPLLASQLSKSAPINNSVPVDRMIWSRRDPRPHINSVNSVAGDSSIADEVQEALSSLSPSDLNDIDSEEEEEHKSDGEGESDFELNIDEDITPGSSVKKDRFFWQYNVQAKGPKGHKIALLPKIHDPYTLDEVIDPVFSDEIQVHGIKHSGKARRGDGNDLTANPKKLAAIGKELESLGKIINEMAPVSEIPMPSRTTSRKEKNKLASRACRLKKKAQHEANKLKLHGLEEEHSDLLRSISQCKELLISKMSRNCESSQTDLTNEADKLVKRSQKNRVSGLTTEYVNKMIVKHS